MQAALEQPVSTERQMIGGVGYAVGGRAVARGDLDIKHGDIGVVVLVTAPFFLEISTFSDEPVSVNLEFFHY